MASNPDFVQYIADQCAGAGEITVKKMFGDYGIYCDGMIFGLICDNRFYLKPTEAGRSLLRSVEMRPPYDGAKDYFFIEDVDDRDYIAELVRVTCKELPPSKLKTKKKMIEQFVNQHTAFPFEAKRPWKITAHLAEIISKTQETLDDGYVIKEGVAIHKTAVIGHNVTIKAPAIISADCFVGSNSYLRDGVFLAPGAKVGISCEVKTSILLEGSAIAHFNFIGDSIIGQNVNIEAGAILANHYNEREDDTVFVHIDGQRISTGLHKFGSLVGDDCRIGANAVLSPGTLLKPKTIVKRLELIEQDPL